MTERLNDLGQPIGAAVDGWQPVPRPSRITLEGKHCRIEPLDAARHASELFAAYREDKTGRVWTYMSQGPFGNVQELQSWLETAQRSEDPLFFTIIDGRSGNAAGVMAFLRIVPDFGVIEIGNIAFTPCLQRTAAATEAIYLTMHHVFQDLGYRRYEWKCDALNAPSRQAAERFGFTYDGLFRQALIYKGRNRDTAWYSILDKDWPALDAAYREWLDDANFDGQGRQRQRLADCIARRRDTLERG